jgi:hypothetical protein
MLLSIEWPVLTAFVVALIGLTVIAWIWTSIGGMFWAGL